MRTDPLTRYLHMLLREKLANRMLPSSEELGMVQKTLRTTVETCVDYDTILYRWEY
jgi:4-alpha-glucanotransferase